MIIIICAVGFVAFWFGFVMAAVLAADKIRELEELIRFPRG